MKEFLLKTILPIIAATIWIVISEFVRNQFLVIDTWLAQYASLGIPFPNSPINGAVWGIWSLCYAIVIYVINRKFQLIESIILTWFIGFVLMWLVIGNLGVLPLEMLPIAIPLSIVESAVANVIISKFKRQHHKL